MNFCMTSKCETKTTTRPLKLSLSSCPVTHNPSIHTHFQPADSTSAPCKLSLIPCRSDLCQTCVTFRGVGLSRHPHTLTFPFVYLFLSLCFLVSAFTLSISYSMLLTRICTKDKTSVRSLVFCFATSGCFSLKCL